MVDQGGTLQPKDASVIARAVRRVRGTPYNLIGGRIRGRANFSRGLESFVTVINKTGSKLDAFSVVRIERSVTNEVMGNEDDEFPLLGFRWEATAPNGDLTGIYGVLQNAAVNNGPALALVSGVTKVRLDDAEEGNFAVPVSGDMTKMETDVDGSFQVLAVDSAGEASTWGYVLLGRNNATEYKWAIFDGSRSSKRYTGHIKLDSGDLGDSIQWIFWNDTGVADLLDANDIVIVLPCPVWNRTNSAYGEGLGDKYIGILSPWAAMA